MIPLSVRSPPMSDPVTVQGTVPGASFASPAWLSRGERGIALVVAVAALSILLVAARLEPSPTGVGTHQQLMLPPCTWPLAVGLPCPACGMTTSFAHAANADLLSSFVAQPAGAMLALATAGAAVLGFFAAFTGTRVLPVLAPLASKRALVVFVAVLLLSWGYKIIVYRNGLTFPPMPIAS